MDYRLKIQLGELEEGEEWSAKSLAIYTQYYKDLLAIYKEDTEEYYKALTAKADYEQKYEEKRRELQDKFAAFEAQFNSTDQLVNKYANNLKLLEEFRRNELMTDQTYLSLRKKLQDDFADSMTDTYMAMAMSVSGSLKSIGDSLVDLCGETKEAAVAQKAFGLASVIINEAVNIANTARAITSAVAAATDASAATGPAAPFTQPVFVATMVSTIAAALAGTIGNIVQAKQLLQSADTDAGKYEHGGVVPGTSYTGDRMVANVNSREAILTLGQQKTLFDIANGRTPAFDYDALAGVLVAAMAAQPAPVLDLQEFHDFEDKVVTYDEYAKI